VTTSGVYSFSVSRDDVIVEAMHNVGALGESETPTAQEVTDCARKLNMLTKQWMGTQDFAPGLKMWTRQRAALFQSSTQGSIGYYLLGPASTDDDWAATVTALPGQLYGQTQLSANAAAAATTITVGTGAGKIGNFTAADYVVIQLNSGDTYSTTVSTINSGAGTFTIPGPGLPSAANANNYVWNYTTKGQRPLDIVTANLRDINNNDTPLTRMTVQDYEALPTKAMPTYISDPAAFYYETQLPNGRLFLDVYGEQDVTKHLHFVYLRPVQDFSAPGDNPEFPQAWYLPLCWGLSKQIAPMFDAEWTHDMEDNLTTSLAIAREADSEVSSFYFQPNAVPYP